MLKSTAYGQIRLMAGDELVLSYSMKMVGLLNSVFYHATQAACVGPRNEIIERLMNLT
jgi:hypothetical protein